MTSMVEPVAPTEAPVVIRSFQHQDAEACRRLYHEGLLAGTLADNDSGLDIDDIELAYMRPQGNHMFVAELTGGQVVGMIGIQGHEPGVGEIRRLRVADEHRRKGIGSALLERALRFCEERQYLKIMLDTYIDREPAIRLFERFRFKHSRTKRVGQKDLLYFYLDLYQGTKKT